MSIRTRIKACIIIISIMVSLIIVAIKTDAFQHASEYTEFNGGDVAASGIYYTENLNQTGWIFCLGTDGKVYSMTSSAAQGEDRVEAVNVNNGVVYVLYSTIRSLGSSFDGESAAVYRVVSYDSKLRALKDSYRFLPENGETVVSGFRAEESRCYITMIDGTGRSLSVYELPYDDMKEISNDIASIGESHGQAEDEFETLRFIMGRTSNDGSFFADAVYTASNLYVRTPADSPTGVFARDSRIANAVDRMKLSPFQYLSVYRRVWIYWLMGLLLWFVFLMILQRLLHDRNRMIYEIVLMEFLLLIILGGCFAFAGAEYEKAGAEEYLRYATMALRQELGELGNAEGIDYGVEDYFESDDYRRVQQSLTDFARGAGNSAVFRDVFLMRMKDREIVTGISGKNREDAAYLYGFRMQDICDSLSGIDTAAVEQINVDGETAYAVGVRNGGSGNRLALVGIIYAIDPGISFWTDARLRLIIFVLVYLLAGLLMLGVVLLRASDLRLFEHAISEAALGRSDFEVPETPARDLRSMWRSLAELVKRMDEINYSKYRIFEAYYRFAPKNIETVMGKESITDVKNGDVTATEGTLMLVGSSRTGYGEKEIHALNNIIAYMEEYADLKEGILVSEDSALTMLQFLFMKETLGISAYATQFLHRNASDTESGALSVFLYYAPFMYGIVGTQTQSLTYLNFEYAQELERCARWFGKMKLALVITEEVRRRENPGEIRHIGYIRLSDGRKILLYEVLDACPARERQIKLMNKEKFEATMELFYQKDFYLARNQFSELIRELPGDEIAKWYMFESEKYLNGELSTGDFGQLKWES